MRHLRPIKVLPDPLAAQQQASPAKVVPYTCPACERTFMGRRNLGTDWAAPGGGLPADCGNLDCHDYLIALDIMRGPGWMDGEILKEGIPYRLAGFGELAERIRRRREENRADEYTAQERGF